MSSGDLEQSKFPSEELPTRAWVVYSIWDDFSSNFKVVSLVRRRSCGEVCD